MQNYFSYQDPFLDTSPDLQIAFNSSTSTLYTADFPQGKYISMYFDEEKEHFIQVSKKIKLSITCIVNTGYRKRSLQEFEKLLYDTSYVDAYKNENSIAKASVEKVWQHFFKHNQWIFGYGLDYRFQSILQDEVNLNTADLDGKNTVNGDFLLADNKFTTFVEIKRPDTQLFHGNRNRADCWKLSSGLYDAHSQILEHKASGQIKLQMDTTNYDSNDNLVKQKAYDSKTILIIGSWTEINNDNPRIKAIKEKTFELFRQNSKNVEIITFDELFDRAKFIVEHQ